MRLAAASKLWILVIGFSFLSCQQSGPVTIKEPYEGNLERFHSNDVKIQGSPFLEAQKADLKYILALDPDRLLAPFVAEAGMEPKAPRYGNWESGGLDGHTGGHYLSALALMYAASGNEELLERLNYMVHVLRECQVKNGNGYVGGIPGGAELWEEIKAGNIEAGNFSLNGKWVPLYNIHKLYAGLRDAYLIAGSEQARQILVDLTDWMIDVTEDLSDEQIQQMLQSEHGGLNEVFADVAQITQDEQYLKLARRFSHRKILDPLLAQEDRLTGLHANTQIPKVVGFKRIADIEKAQEWDNATRFFWETVVQNRSVSIGGNSVREHFHPTDDFSSMLESDQGPETCNTYNMLRLTQMLFLSDPKAGYMDYYERAMYNHILSSQHPDGGFVYFTPMRPRHYRVYSQPHEAFWCCVGSGLENHAKYGEIIYAKAENDLFVNLFVPSRLTWEEKGLVVEQETPFPEEGRTQIALELSEPKKFAINLRHPSWVAGEGFKVFVNGKSVAHAARASSYIRLEKIWQDGDVIAIEFPMDISLEYLPDGSQWISILRGPIVMAAVTDSTDISGLWANSDRMAHVADGRKYPIDQAPKIIADTDEEILERFAFGRDGVLKYTGDIHPASYRDVKLVPFYQVHEARYMVYWPVMTEEALDEYLEEVKQKEEKMIALERRTVDEVATGEQQPETEHNFKGEQTESGMHLGRFWRHASGWFSYDLNNAGHTGRILRVTYFGADRGRKFAIYLNGVPFKEVVADHEKDEFYDVDYLIPREFSDKAILNVMFKADEGSIAGGVYHIRLLEEEEPEA